MLNIELKDIRSFVILAQFGSVSSASANTGIAKATLSHNLRRLEDQLCVELFTRESKGLSLTDAGRAYLGNCESIFASCEAAASAAQHAYSNVTGSVKISASAEFGTSIIGAAALYLSREHPGLDFDIQMYHGAKDAIEQSSFDCLVFVGEPPDSSLMRQKLGSFKFGLFASQPFLDTHGIPSDIPDLADLPGALYTRLGIPEQWALNKGKDRRYAKFVPRFRVHDYWMAKYFAVAGIALTYLPDFFVHYEVKQAGLVHVLPEWQSEETNIYALYPSFRHKNPRVMTVVETLRSNFKELVRHPGYALIDTTK